MPSTRSCQVSLLAAVVVLLAAQQGMAQTTASEEMESRLREEVAGAVMSNPALHGVWAVVERVEEKGFELKLVVDSQPKSEKSQTEELKRLVKSVVKTVPVKYVVIDRVPFSQYVEELQSDVELDASLAGAAVDGAYYMSESDGEVFVILTGRVINDAQRERLAEMSDNKLKKLFVDSKRELPLTKTIAEKRVGIVAATPSAEVAHYCFGLGVQSHTQGMHADAYQMFTRAHLEAPSRIDIQYWRAVSLIGSGREPDARRLLEGLVKNRQANSIRNEPEVFRSLEPVQGSLRSKLTAMENSLLAKAFK